MLDNPQHDFRTTELDPDLLSTPFRVQTNWHVITGAPCCGKTTLIDQLADKGFQTVPETARQYIEERWPKDERSTRFARMRPALQRSIKDMQLKLSVDYERMMSSFSTEPFQVPSRVTESMD